MVRGARWGIRYGPSPALEDSLFEGLRDAYAGCSMADTAENLAQEYGITREECEDVAVRSHANAKGAWQAGAFRDEVIGVPIRDRRTKQEIEWIADEHIRPDTSRDSLARLPALFRNDGTVTAGTASGINDGAGMMV